MQTEPRPGPTSLVNPMSDDQPMSRAETLADVEAGMPVRPPLIPTISRDIGAVDPAYPDSPALAFAVQDGDIVRPLGTSTADGLQYADTSADSCMSSGPPPSGRPWSLPGNPFEVRAPGGTMFTAFGQQYVMDQVTRALVIERIDVDPWRVPQDGLLEYDPVHDEWRIELYWSHVWPEAGRIIVRRYAGQRAARALGSGPRPGRPTNLNRYLVGGDKPGAPAVSWRPPDDGTHATYLARWRRVAQTYERARRPLRHAPDGTIRKRRHRYDDGSDQVDAMTYSLSTISSMVGPPAGRFLRDAAAAIAPAAASMATMRQGLTGIAQAVELARRERA